MFFIFGVIGVQYTPSRDFRKAADVPYLQYLTLPLQYLKFASFECSKIWQAFYFLHMKEQDKTWEFLELRRKGTTWLVWIWDQIFM